MANEIYTFFFSGSGCFYKVMNWCLVKSSMINLHLASTQRFHRWGPFHWTSNEKLQTGAKSDWHRHKQVRFTFEQKKKKSRLVGFKSHSTTGVGKDVCLQLLYHDRLFWEKHKKASKPCLSAAQVWEAQNKRASSSNLQTPFQRCKNNHVSKK